MKQYLKNKFEMDMEMLYKKAMEDRTLIPLLSKYRRLLDDVQAQYRRIIGNYEKALIPLLCNIYDEYNSSALPRLEMLNQQRECVIDLRDIKPDLAIRFCGRFYNMMEIDSNDGGIITFAYGITEDNDIPEERFNTDCYTGQQAIYHTMYLRHADIRNVMSLARQLTVYFAESDYLHKYCNIKNELIEAVEKVDKEPLNELKYYINGFLVNLIKQHCNYDESQFMHCLRLPDGINIRYYGRYCNCIITEGLRTSLGYLRNNRDYLNEQMYGNDGYTSKYVAGGRHYQLLHYTPLGNHSEQEHTYKALMALSRTCVSPIDIDEFDYVLEDDISKEE